MGASSSLVNTSVYLSCGTQTPLTEKLKEKLNESGMTIYSSENEKMNLCNILLMCIQRDTPFNYSQICDQNKAIESDIKIVYIMMDSTYNHRTNPELNRCFPMDKSTSCFEEAYLSATVFEVQKKFILDS